MSALGTYVLPANGHCDFLEVDEDELDTSDLHTRLTSAYTRQKLLLPYELVGSPGSTRQTSSPETLLEDLKQLAGSLAAEYTTKPSVATDLAFKLIHDFDFEGEARAHIALSYVWKDYNRNAPQRLTSPVGDLPFGWLRTVEQFPLPTSRAMFLAVLNERRPGEGLWYDQVCIDQQDKREKALAVGAMDLVYKHARAVVVALDDISVTDSELVFLQWYTQQFPLSDLVHGQHPVQGLYPPYLQQHVPFRSFVDRILNSSCFDRAWCAQEMRLGQSHVFLVPCSGHGEDEVCTIIRFTVDFFRHILVLAGELVNTSNSQQARIRSLLHHFQMSSLRNEPKQLGLRRPSMKLNAVPSSISIVATITDVLNLKTSGNPDLPEYQRSLDANRDKISITLNMVGLPLALKAATAMSRPCTEDECLRQLLLIALAARDPVSLCTTGPPLQLHNGTTSWLCRPTPVDKPSTPTRAPLPFPRSSRSITHESDGKQDFVQLELVFLEQPHRAQPNPAFPAHIIRARDLIDLCIHHQIRSHSLWNLWQTAQSARAPAMRNIYIQTLACALDCGSQWMLTIASQLTSDLAIEPQLFETLFNPRLILQNFILHPGSSSALSTLVHMLSLVITQGVAWASGAFECTHGPLIVTLPTASLPTPLPSAHPAEQHASTGRALIFAPFAHSKNLLVAVPAAVKASAHSKLARGWILTPGGYTADNPGPGVGWTLRGKSTLFGDAAFVEGLEEVDGMRHSVYGPRNI